ncbi:MAG TPA: NADPH:quinone oxidoreductase family protein [Novosphingobium sp.]|nr:NADPH:quinone oxidoreductase family protein [Novosphingobium sp.]
MKALRSHQPGGPDTLVLDEVPAPMPGPGELLVAVRAVGINFLDTLIIEDQYQVRPPRPFSPGAEVAGVVEAVGPDAGSWKPGDRVIAQLSHGGLAQKVLVDPARAFALPDAVSFATGAGLLITYGTAIYALTDRARARAGETMLVLGAGGGAGLAAVELGRALGLRVIGAVSSPDKAEAVHAAGASEVVIYARAPFDKAQSRALGEQFKAAIGPGGADIVYDCVGGDYAEPALRSLGWGGRYLPIGFTAGIPVLPMNLPLLKTLDICGVFYGAFAERDPARNAELVADLLDLVARGRVAAQPPRTWPLERGGEAIAALADRQAVGKAIVTIAE